MIHPSHPALRSRGVGPVSAAIPLKPSLQRAQHGETKHRERRHRPWNSTGRPSQRKKAP